MVAARVGVCGAELVVFDPALPDGLGLVSEATGVRHDGGKPDRVAVPPGYPRSGVDWQPITRALWVCALYAVPCLGAAWWSFTRRDVTGG